MLSKLLQAVRSWARRIWRRRAQSADPQTDSSQTGGNLTNTDPGIEPDEAHLLPDRPPSDPPPAEQPPPGESTEAAEPIATDGDGTDTDTGADSTDDEPLSSSKPKMPPAYGGRRRGSSPGESPRNSPNAKPEQEPRVKLKPELVCRKPTGFPQWTLILTVPSDSEIENVTQGDVTFPVSNGEYALESFTTSLTITYDSGECLDIQLFDGKPMVFKFRTDWIGDGRKVRAITKGCFIVITPSSWKRIGSVPVEPVICSDENFTAHYFYCKSDHQVEDVGGFAEWKPTLVASKFKLEGNLVYDSFQDVRLYSGDVPELICGQDVAWARVGSEGNNEWSGENFCPDTETLADVLNERQGSFFIRVYNQEITLLDSGEFRFMREIQEIAVNGEPYSEELLLLPAWTGHAPAKVRLINANGTIISPRLETSSAYTSVEADGTIIVDSHPDGDRLRCSVVANDSIVDLAIDLPRVWWRLEQGDEDASEWSDTVSTLTREEFRQYADTDWTLRIRLQPHFRSIHAGFGEDLRRKYRNEQTCCSIPLADFRDDREIIQRLDQDAMLVIRCGQTVFEAIRVSADPVPTIVTFESKPASIISGEIATLRWATQDAAGATVSIKPEIGEVAPNGSVQVTPAQTMTFTLSLKVPGTHEVTRAATLTVQAQPTVQELPRSHVTPRPLVGRKGGGWREGKGFSRDEFHAVGIIRNTAVYNSLPVDNRRRSAHSLNIKALRRLTDAQA